VFITLLVVTLAIAVVTAFSVAQLFNRPIGAILARVPRGGVTQGSRSRGGVTQGRGQVL